MNKFTILIYVLIVGAAVISSIYKKMKKASGSGNNQPKKPISTFQQPKPQQKPQSQPKTLDEILKSLMNETQPPVTKTTNTPPNLVNTDKEDTNVGNRLEENALEKMEREYYELDTELEFNSEQVDYDQMTDHQVHGFGFDKKNYEEASEEEGEWANIDWRKAVITAEILRRPDY